MDRLWGPALVQGQPTSALTIERSDVRAKLHLEQRQKGLVWFPTYTVELAGKFTFKNEVREGSAKHPGSFDFSLPLMPDAVYQDLEVRDENGRPVQLGVLRDHASWSAEVPLDGSRTFSVGYLSRGTTRWIYDLKGDNRDVKNFRLTVDSDFEQVDFPIATTSPTAQAKSGGSWHGEWSFRSLVASEPIGIEMPTKLNPGPLAAKITFFAPVSLLFYFFVVGVLAAARKLSLHPMHFFLVGCAFFAFHLLFAYLVDHLAIAPSFALASAVSIALTVSYARWFVGWRFALREMGLAQLTYLVLFSFTFFWSGFTGLAITVGAILTLAVIMQITGRVRWGQPEPEPARACPTPYRCSAEGKGAEWPG